jgi:S1-C subfamily serine protease
MQYIAEARAALTSTTARLVYIGAAVASTVLILMAIAPSLHQKYLFHTVGRSVVSVVIPSNHASGGTGFNVKTPSGKVVMLTNRHICQLAENGVLEVSTTQEPERYYRVSVREESRTTDLCITDPAPTSASISLARSVSVGEQIGVLGHPHLEPNTLSLGMVTNKQTITLPFGFNIPEEKCAYYGGKTLEAPPLAKMFFGIESGCFTDIESYRTTAVVYGGNSGSPAVDVLGRLTGVLFAGNTRSNYGFIVPLEKIKEFLKNY